MKYIFKEEGQISSKEFSELEKLLVPLFSFSYHFTQNYKQKNVLYFSSKPSWRLFIYEGDELIGSLSIVDRRIKEPLPLRIAGLGNLAIKKSHQNQGLSIKALQKTHKFLKKQNMDISLLFCVERLKKIYLKAGYQQLVKPVTYLNEAGKVDEEPLSLLYPISISKNKVKKVISSSLFIGKGSW